MSITGTAEQKTKALQKIKELKRRKAELKNRVQNEKESNTLTLKERAGELCAREMTRYEQVLEDAIQAVDKDCILLADWLECCFNPQYLIESFKARIQEYSDEIAEVTRKKKEAEVKLKKQERIKELLG